MSAKIIVLEGLDCSFKETNSKLLKEYLESIGKSVALHSFPNYGSNSSFFVTEYLNRSLGNLEDIDPRVVSMFFAMDRFYTFNKFIKEDYETKDYIIFDRYVESNFIYQGSRIPENSRNEFFDYMKQLEYGYMGLPKPDITLFLRLDLDIVLELLKKKNSNDIYESNAKFQTNLYSYTQTLIDNFSWNVVNMGSNGAVNTKEQNLENIITVLREKEII